MQGKQRFVAKNWILPGHLNKATHLFFFQFYKKSNIIFKQEFNNRIILPLCLAVLYITCKIFSDRHRRCLNFNSLRIIWIWSFVFVFFLLLFYISRWIPALKSRHWPFKVIHCCDHLIILQTMENLFGITQSFLLHWVILSFNQDMFTSYEQRQWKWDLLQPITKLILLLPCWLFV